MDLNLSIINLLKQLQSSTNSKLSTQLQVTDSIQILADNQVFASITKQQILLGNTDISNKISDNKGCTNQAIFPKATVLIEKISPFVTSLNHIGISYVTKNMNEELCNLVDFVKTTPFHLYEEKSSVKSAKWFFVGDKTKPNNPMFELVLNQPNTIQQDWYPHFQIDVDTTLKAKELSTITSAIFSDSTTSFKKNYLQLFVLGQIDGIKIVIGIGTNTRQILKQRQNLFAWS